MPKKRRKLNKDFEKSISEAKRSVELIQAKIHDIQEDDIQAEYAEAFLPVKQLIINLDSFYKTDGYNDTADKLYEQYSIYLKAFKDEYEI